MKIDIDPQAVSEFVTLLKDWSLIDKDDPEDTKWEETTDKTVALMAMSEDLLSLLGEGKVERTDAYASYLAENKYYRPMTSP